MRIYRVVVPVEDLEQAVAFYGRVLDLAGERISSGRHYFDCGGVLLVCLDPDAEGDDPVPVNGGIVYFAVDDLAACFERAQAAGCSWMDGRPRERAWGERSFYVRDPFGNPLCFVDERTLYTGSRDPGA